MTTGFSGTYALAQTTLQLQPTSGKWVAREEIGVDGGGHPVYPAVREFELKWDLMSTDDWEQLVGFYNQVSATGTITADLPQYAYGATTYKFYRYSGTTLQEPEVGEYFVGYVKDVTMLVLKVRT